MATSRVRYAECCQHCGNPLTPGGVALACGPGGGARIKLPDYCADADCRRERDERAMADAIARGVIDP